MKPLRVCPSEDFSGQGEKNGRQLATTCELTAANPFRFFIRATASLFTPWAQACPKTRPIFHAARGEERAGEPISSDAACPTQEPLASGTPCKWDATQPTVRGEL